MYNYVICLYIQSCGMYIFYYTSEWKYFLLYYIPAGLYGILPDKYYVHVFLLIKSIWILLSHYISEEGLQLAEKLLKKFCFLQEHHYGNVLCCFSQLDLKMYVCT